MKAAIYLRVSSKEQDPENQLPALEGAAQRLGAEIVEV
jgi:DNA invertase Pin-like site-specific DNA recombinase